MFFSGDEYDSDFDENACIEKILGIICDGKTAEYDDWSVSAKVDGDGDSITISVVSK